jgi:hypothetical protein
MLFKVARLLEQMHEWVGDRAFWSYTDLGCRIEFPTEGEEWYNVSSIAQRPIRRVY